MTRTRLAVAAAALAAAVACVRPAGASCGSSSCPIDVASHEQPTSGLLRLDASFQYIDQNAPRAGLHRAAVGEVPNPEHNEVRTINRVWTLRGDYDVDERWGAGLVLPMINRSHDHISVDSGSDEHWSFTGLGDITVQGRFAALMKAGPQSPGVTLSAGVKLPSGRTDARNDTEQAEVTIQPGTGSTDLVFGAAYSQSVARAKTLTGAYAYVPVFASVTYKQNNPGSRGYRFGDGVETTLGGAYTALRDLDLLAQVNLRVHLRDYNGATGEDTSFTGGNFLYMSPGLRWRFARGLSAYGYLQLPVYQRVNQEQLTADRHWLFGLTYLWGPAAR
jgi:hypothetical protein